MQTGTQTNKSMQYEIQDVAEARAEKQFIEDCYNAMFSDEQFDVVPSSMRTQAFQSGCTRQFTRATARMHAIVDATTNYPFKSFASLNHPELHEEIRTDALCPRRLESWSRKVDM